MNTSLFEMYFCMCKSGMKGSDRMSDIDKIICTKHGGNPIGLQNYYIANDATIFSGIGYIPICKDCLYKKANQYYNRYNDMQKTIYYMCRKVDIAFDSAIFDAAERKGKNNTKKVFQSYMTQYNSLGKENNTQLNFDDGEHLETIINIEDVDSDGKNEVSKDMTIFWGRGLKDWEYEFLENELVQLKTDFECNDYGMEMIMKDIAFINLDIYNARSQNQTKAVTSLIKTRSNLMNDGNLKPIQATGADKNEKMSLGVFIKKWENEKPIEEKSDDEMKRYIDTFMVGHLAEMQGIENDFTQKYREAIDEYTIDFEDLYVKDGDT